MLPAEIKFRLAIAEPQPYTQAAIATECRVANSMVWDVIHGNRRNDRVALRIAEILLRKPADIWPKVYGPTAKRRPLRNRAIPLNQIAVAG
jgi:hypothetical protein